ncbi:MAG: DNA-3-methyladenine glycosylase [Deltaproteobacteria bacterium]|nr:DNA-3-methyladenine glycosylase [Deltaproteobacteria bacterium]
MSSTTLKLGTPGADTATRKRAVAVPAPCAPLDRSFFARDADVVARELIGGIVRCGAVAVRLVEVEAYALHDTACHAHKGKTARTAPLFGPPGHAYIYLCYGIHKMLNLVSHVDGSAGGILVRGAEVVEGVDVVAARRGIAAGPGLCSGPGKIGVALALDTKYSGTDLFGGGLLTFERGPVGRVIAAARIGIEYASPADRARKWRFADADSKAVSHRRRF